jgi:nucleoside-diphosphate-sugar epimerase
MKKQFNIAISCIGSGVGQSVINSCKLSSLPIRTFGFGTNPFAYGLYECDEYVYTPTIYQADYVDILIGLCKKHKIDLVIPGMDDEAHIFSQNIEKFNAAGIKTIVAGEELLDICRDKEKMSNELNKIANVFVKSYDKENFLSAVQKKEIDFPVIAKPRSGFASRGIEIINSEADIHKITDSHIIQELAVPHSNDPDREFYDRQIKRNINPQVSEISIQLVANKKGEIIGRMMSYNKLNNGVPIEILPYDNELIWNEVDKLYPTFKKLGLKGPFNLQGRLTDKGLKLFELNARFTGITGLRAYMGFNEVEACIKEWLDIKSPTSKLQLNNEKFGIRQTADKAISFDRNPEALDFMKRVNGKTLKEKKNILITGATGYLGQNLINKLHKEDSFVIYALVRNKDKAKQILPANIICFDNNDMNDGTLSLGNIDILLHAGFARPHCSLTEIADSITFTAELFTKAVANQVSNIINISSQSVYGQADTPPWSEMSSVAPSTPYGSAKYSSELILKSLAQQHKHINYTSIRLGALSGGASGFNDTDLLAKLVVKALNSEKINIVGGNQLMDRLDIRDAVDAIIAMLNTPSSQWKSTYNLGAKEQIKLIELAGLVADITAKEKNIVKSEIALESKDIKQNFGLNCESFQQDFKWVPSHDISDCIKSVIAFYN